MLTGIYYIIYKRIAQPSRYIHMLLKYVGVSGVLPICCTSATAKSTEHESPYACLRPCWHARIPDRLASGQPLPIGALVAFSWLLPICDCWLMIVDGLLVIVDGLLCFGVFFFKVHLKTKLPPKGIFTRDLNFSRCLKAIPPRRFERVPTGLYDREFWWFFPDILCHMFGMCLASSWYTDILSKSTEPI